MRCDECRRILVRTAESGSVSRFIVEADGGSRGNPGPAAYGTVVKDAETGAVLRELRRAHRHRQQQRRGVPRADRRAGGRPRARPGGDRRGAAGLQARRRADVRAVEDQAPGHARRSRCGPATSLPPTQVTYVWVPRERNKHADRLANEALDAAARGEAWSAGRQHRRAARAGRRRGAPGGRRRGGRSRPPDAGRLGRRPRRPDHHGAAAARRDARTPSRSGSAAPAVTTPSCPRRASGRRPPSRTGSRPPGASTRSLASPMRRTRQTADAVAAALGADGARGRRLPRVRVRRVGGADVRRGPRAAGRTRSAAWLRRPDGRAARRRVVRRRTAPGAAGARPAAGPPPAADRAGRHPRDADQGAGGRRAGRTAVGAVPDGALAGDARPRCSGTRAARPRCAASTTPPTCSDRQRPPVWTLVCDMVHRHAEADWGVSVTQVANDQGWSGEGG